MNSYKFKTKPFAHQSTVLKECWDHENWALFLDMGTGKSKICIDNVAVLFQHDLIDTFVVVAPKGVYRNWAVLEIPKHLPDSIDRHLAVWTPTPNKAQKQVLLGVLEPSESLRILVMNIEALSTPRGQRFLGQLLRESQALLAIDASTAIKSPKARRTKAVIKLGELAKYRRILTGSPVTQSPLDLWSQCRFLDKHLLGEVGNNFYQYQYRYAVMKRRQVGTHAFNLVVGYRDLDRLSWLLKRFSHRIRKDECLDLPPKIYTQRNITLSEDQARIYNELREFALAQIGDDEFMTTTNVMTQLLRLQQVLSGHTKSDGGDLIEINDNRLNELLTCLEEIEGKVIIWSRFRYDVQRISQALIKKYGADSTVLYYGDTSDEERTRGIERFQNGKAMYFVGNPQTGGYGITLTAAQTVIYFSNSFDLAVRMQSEDRAHRIGQHKSVTYIDFIAEKTIDERIVKALRNKMDIASEVLGENLRNWLTK